MLHLEPRPRCNISPIEFAPYLPYTRCPRNRGQAYVPDLTRSGHRDHPTYARYETSTRTFLPPVSPNNRSVR